MNSGQDSRWWEVLLRFPVLVGQLYFQRMQQNNSMAMSAALSFQTIFALVPTLVLTLLILKAYYTPEESEQFLRNGLEAFNLTEIKIVQTEEGRSFAGPDDPCVFIHAENKVMADPCAVHHVEKEVFDDPCGSGHPSGQAAMEISEKASKQNVKEIASLADEIVKQVKNVEKKLSNKLVGPIGFLVLIWTAIRLMVTIEQSLNRIYGARQSRGWVKRAMLYWSVLSLVPILWVVANYIGNVTLQSLPESQLWSVILNITGRIGPLLISIVSLAAIYKLMPNTRISFMAAVGGALVAVPLWLGLKWLFQIYVEQVVGRNSVYGAMGLIPIFLIWLHWSWTIFLFGAELSHTATNLKRMRAEELASRINLGPNDMLAAVLIVAQSYVSAKGPARFDDIAEKLNLPDESVEQLLNRLVDKKIISPVENGTENPQYLLARPADKIKLVEVMEIDRPATAYKEIEDESVMRMLVDITSQTQNKLGAYTLADALVPRMADAVVGAGS